MSQADINRTTFLTVKDIQSILGFCETSTYNLVHRPDFPKMKIGHKFLIPEDKFYEYMDAKCYTKVQ